MVALKHHLFKAAGLLLLTLLCSTNSAFAQEFTPQFAADFGNSHRSYPPSNAIDGNTSFGSRWAATFEGGSANLVVDLGSVKTIDDVGVAWGRGDQRSYRFEIRARSGTSGSWAKLFSGNSSGRSTSVENYNVTDFAARQVRVKVFSNSAGSNWADITEFKVFGTGSENNIGRVSVPRLIQAEDFTDYRDDDSNNRGGQYRNTGVDIENCSDSNCGFNVGWMRPGEWLEYNISVASSGTYSAQMRLAARRSDAQYSIAIDGSNVTGNQAVGTTGGWQSWVTRTVNLGNLSSGNHTIRVNVENSGFNFNWMNVIRTGGTTPIDTDPEFTDPDNNDFGLDRNAEPWENFDLRRWTLDTPAPRNDDRCRAERTWDHNWDDNDPLESSSEPFFFTHSDGGLRFVTRIDGQTTNSSCDSGFVRSELREMIRAGDRNIDDTGVTKNNWKLGYQPGNDSNWGGVNGELNATLRVNKVTTSGDSGQVGRVIVGQIHAGNDEPLRLYYRKRSGQSKGCVYFGHEIRGDDDVWFEMIGDRNCTSGPSNGIELNELFSYSIINDDEDIRVVIRRGDQNGPIIAQRTIDMNLLNSGYDRSDEWMYFKLGAYTQNDSGNGSDGDIVTFYRMSVSHD